MRILNQEAICLVCGGYEKNMVDGFEVASALALMGGLVGGPVGFLCYSAPTALTQYLIGTVASGGILVNLPIAIFAGIGFGTTLGALTGAALYASGVIYKE